LPQKKEKQMYRPVLLILLMIRVWTGVAQEGVVRLSLDDALERFAACNLSLIAERYHVDMAEAQVTQAKLFENPVVSFEQNVYNRNNGKYFDLGKEGEAVVEIEQLIYIADIRSPGHRPTMICGCSKDRQTSPSALPEAYGSPLQTVVGL